MRNTRNLRSKFSKLFGIESYTISHPDNVEDEISTPKHYSGEASSPDPKICWYSVIYYQLFGVYLPVFDVYSDIGFMITNQIEFYPKENDYRIPLGGNCEETENANEAYCKLSYSEQCK